MTVAPVSCIWWNMPPRIRPHKPKARRTFIREWRKYRGLSQDGLVDRVSEVVDSFSKSSLSRLESGRQPYSQPILEALSIVLECEPQDLLTRNPKVEDPAWDLFAQVRNASPQELAQISAVADALLKVSRH